MFVGTAPRCKKLLPQAVPSIFPWKKTPSAAAVARNKRRQNAHAKTIGDNLQKEVKEVKEVEEDNIKIVMENACEFEVGAIMDAQVEVTDHDEPMHVSQSTQSDTPLLSNSFAQTVNSETFKLLEKRKSLDDYMNDPEGVQYYTGLSNHDMVLDVLASLGPAAYSLNYINGNKPSLPVKDQFFMTLIKLRQYQPNFELSRDFKICETDVYNIVVTWIRFMSLQWREIDIWPCRDIVHFYSPADFKSKFPTTRVVVDGAEFPMKKPSVPAAQQVTYSTYKNKNTAKVLVGVTPGGQVSYVSPAYGGSTSDRQIVERSQLPTMCDAKDTIMADKGFDVQDIFAPYDVGINIPTFFKKKNRMSGETVLKDRKIASKRVHVERVIGLGKTYKILCNPLKHSESLLASDISFICYMLVNFRPCIVPKDA